ncbi:glutamine ABC transporter substrate-binding protein GlnH [Microlunatus endophyticus]|uniref:Glutamine ABC transporter substrate-binding protein GlnH n=1 Tax=Microlunatus endophyticus TaxID=1716077 RepID=A0A917S6C0_9ACTN|nr:ABC transporter substrate-binding protein [Microlunatus endophyticus]GGL58244.1 glutamine ABC transporter substrate-binding protein GlnH [Microlunatus endophyticus]
MSGIRTKIITGCAIVVAVALAGCGQQPSGGLQASPAPSGKDCTVKRLPLKNPGRFTVGTDSPAYPPWFKSDNPNNGQGYESALIYAIAKDLGFTDDEVDWVDVGFNAAIAPGEKTFDVDINQVTITSARRQNVDLSDPYYTGYQAVITIEGDKLAGDTSIAELRGGKLGAQADSTSLDAINNVIKPDVPPTVLATNDAGVKALEQKKIDGLVVDLPTAAEMVSGEVDGGLMVGRLPTADGNPEQFGLVLDHGSKLTGCINQTLATLHDNGAIASLQGKWLNPPDVPLLKN